MYVQRDGATSFATAGPPAVEVSYDDGATWRPVPLRRDHDRWQATVDHPRAAEFVSLRASAADREGNSVEHTIIRAYALR